MKERMRSKLDKKQTPQNETSSSMISKGINIHYFSYDIIRGKDNYFKKYKHKNNV